MANHHPVSGDWEYNSYPEEYDPRYGQQHYSPQYPPQHFADPTATPRSLYQHQHGHPLYLDLPPPQPHSTSGRFHSGEYIHVPSDDRLARHQGSLGPAVHSHPVSRGPMGPTHRPSGRRGSHAASHPDSGGYAEQFDGQPRVSTRRPSRSARHGEHDGHRGELNPRLQGLSRPDLGPHPSQSSGRHSSRQHEAKEEDPTLNYLSTSLRDTHLTTREPAAPPSIPSQIITATASSTLDPRYRVRKDAATFFTQGRVFSVLWHENAGSTAGQTNATCVGTFGERIYSHIRRMVVVKVYSNCSWCFAIYTYGNRGVTKQTADASKHAIIYMEGSEPIAHRDEHEMLSLPLEVRPTSDIHKLSPMSRLNFGKLFTVEHNVKVLHIGKISERSMPHFLSYARREISI